MVTRLSPNTASILLLQAVTILSFVLGWRHSCCAFVTVTRSQSPLFHRISAHTSTPLRTQLFLADSNNNNNNSNNSNKDDENANTNDTNGEPILECVAPDPVVATKDRLKRELLQLSASYDRGYGASPRARQEIARVIQELEDCNTETNASRGIEGSLSSSSSSSSSVSSSVVSPLQGNWRMIYTTATDVLLLEASPFFSTGAIYQVFDPPVVTNIIDFLPRIQALVPPNVLPNSLIRAKVTTRASVRSDSQNRIGLVFERVQVQPLEILGQTVDVFPPLGWDLPQLPGVSSAEDGPGYFDVTYLDSEMLIIQQNAPGGLFVLVRVESIDA